jgi:sigma-B regulation protein RsbU (phosphoserine phosphatase)
MTLFRSLIRAIASVDVLAHSESTGGIDSAMRLKNAVSLTNNYVAETHGKTSMFATIFFGILDTRTGVLAYVNGGHLPPMVINKRGAIEMLKRTGPAVGLVTDAQYAIRQAVIERGDTLFAYTDGLTDTANAAGEFFSEEGLSPLLGRDQKLSLSLGHIQELVENYAAGIQQVDDITMLAVRRK